MHKRKKRVTQKQIEANRKNALLGGRPIGSMSEENKIRLEMRRRLTQYVNDRFEPIAEALLDVALGYYVEKEMADGTKRVYKKRPDYFALSYLLDQMIGKSEQSLKILGQIDTTEKHVVEMTPEDKTLLKNALRYAIKGGKEKPVIRGEVVEKD